MKIEMSIVDLTALPYWPHYLKASTDVHASIDHHHALRTVMGLALSPLYFSVHAMASPNASRRLLIYRFE